MFFKKQFVVCLLGSLAFVVFFPFGCLAAPGGTVQVQQIKPPQVKALNPQTPSGEVSPPNTVDAKQEQVKEAAQNSPVRLSAEVGWEGRGVSGKTIPAVVRLKNTTQKDLSGVVEVINYYKYIPPLPPGSPPGAKPVGPARYYPVSSFGERVSLPAGSEKRVILWFPLEGYGDQLVVRFSASGEVLGTIKTKLPISGTGGPLPLALGVFGKAPQALEKLRLTMPDGVPRAPLVLKLTPELLPAAGQELDAFTLILVTGEAARRLTPEQRQALVDWTAMGGHLLLSGGLGINDTLSVLPEKTISVTSQGVSTRSNWQDAAGWLGQGVSGTPAPVAMLGGEGEPLGAEKEPLGLQVKIGSGKVTVFAFDPTRAPWEAGALGKALWEKLLQQPAKAVYYGGPAPFSFRLENLMGFVNNLPVAAFPDWRVVGMFLGLFLVAAGPLTYWVLRRRQRPEYTWMAVPLLALIFSGLAYSYMLKTGQNVIVNIIQSVDATENGQNNQVITVAGFFAPTKPVFTAALADPGCPVRVQSFGGVPPELRKPDKEPPYTVIRGSDLSLTYREMSQWGMRNLAFSQEAGEFLDGLKASLSVEGNHLVGRVRNDTPLLLEHVTMLLGDDYRGLGDLAPGQEKRFTMEAPAPPSYNPQLSGPPPGYFPTWQVFVYPEGKQAALNAAKLNAAQKGRHYSPEYGPPPRQLTVEEQRRVNMMENLLSSRRQGPGMEFQGGWPLTLIAFSREPVKQVQIKDLRSKPHYLSVMLKKPEIAMAPGSFSIPAGLVVPEIADSQAMGGMFGHNNLSGLNGGSITYAFRPGLPQEAKIKEVKVDFPYYPGLQQPGMPKDASGPPSSSVANVGSGALEIYNPAKGQWQELAGAKKFDLSGEYALPDGEVRLRVNGFNPESGKAFYFLSPSVAYQGVKE
jgi:hypothetical protein